MGYQQAWAYEEVVELVFEEGKLLKELNHSEKIKEIRQVINDNKNKKDKKKVDIGQFIKQSFSLNLEDKAWWLK